MPGPKGEGELKKIKITTRQPAVEEKVTVEAKASRAPSQVQVHDSASDDPARHFEASANQVSSPPQPVEDDEDDTEDEQPDEDNPEDSDEESDDTDDHSDEDNDSDDEDEDEDQTNKRDDGDEEESEKPDEDLTPEEREAKEQEVLGRKAPEPSAEARGLGSELNEAAMAEASPGEYAAATEAVSAGATAVEAGAGTVAGAEAGAAIAVEGTAAAAAGGSAAIPVIGIILIIIAILLVVVFLVAIFINIKKNGTAGRAEVNPVRVVVDDKYVKILLALTGDPKAKEELLKGKVDDLKKALKDLTDYIDKNDPYPNAKQTIKNKIQEIQDAADTLVKIIQEIDQKQAILDKQNGGKPKATGKVIKPGKGDGTVTALDQERLKKAQDDLLARIDELVKMLRDNAGTKNQQIVAIARQELRKKVYEHNNDNHPLYHADENGEPINPPVLAPYNLSAPRSEDRAWCASFVMWVYHQAGYSSLPQINAVPSLWKYMTKKHYTFMGGEDTPKPGDMHFDNFHTDGPWHVGIVVSVNGDTAQVIDGNSHNQVRTYSITISSAYGFGRMSE